jgi:nitrogen regulatory protein P-II 2
LEDKAVPLPKYQKRQLTIVAEAVLESRLIEHARRYGAMGYTAAEVRGGGEHGVKESAWDADRMIELKVVADEAVIDALAEHVLAQYAPNFALSMFLSDVQVLRPQKF